MLHAVEVDPNDIDRVDPSLSVMLFEEFTRPPAAGDILLVNNSSPPGENETGRSTGHVVRTAPDYGLAWVKVDWDSMTWS